MYLQDILLYMNALRWKANGMPHHFFMKVSEKVRARFTEKVACEVSAERKQVGK